MIIITTPNYLWYTSQYQIMKKNVEQKLDTFFSQFRTIHFKKGEIITNATDPIDYIFYLKKGFVRQYFTTADGEDITHHIFKPISYFPIMLALSHTPNSYTFEAIENLHVQKAPTDKVITFLHQEPEVLFDLAQRLSQGLSKLLIKNESILFKDAYTKVASLLTYLAKRFGTPDNSRTVITLPVRHTDLASWLGMERETVSRQIQKLQKKEIVGYNNILLVINDMKKLEQEATISL